MFKNLLNSLPLLLGVGAIAYSCSSFNQGIGTIEKIGNVGGVDTERVGYYNDLPLCDVVPGSVYDGDTIRVNCNGQEKKIRFACIDAPEKNQAMGIESRDYLRNLLASRGNQVRVDEVTTDQYGRTVAELWAGSELVQSRQALEGMVWGYERYKDDCKSWEAVASLEAQARAEGKGIWGTSNPIPPWEFRSGN